MRVIMTGFEVELFKLVAMGGALLGKHAISKAQGNGMASIVLIKLIHLIFIIMNDSNF
jgi:hypothetical protein